MPRASKSNTDFDEAVSLLAGHGARRKQHIRIRIKITNAAGAIIRLALGWSADLQESERASIAKKAAKILSAKSFSELPDDLRSVAVKFAGEIATAHETSKPWEKLQNDTEREMKRIARQFPVWPWVKGVHGLSDLGLAIIVSEAGRLDAYETTNKDGKRSKGYCKLWRRLGLAPVAPSRHDFRSGRQHNHWRYGEWLPPIRWRGHQCQSKTQPLRKGLC